jgi:hypothetical protein
LRLSVGFDYFNKGNFDIGKLKKRRMRESLPGIF